MKQQQLRVFLITLFFNMVVTYFIGYRYKDYLNNLLSPAIYYQAVVFTSLTLPLLISWVYGHCNRKVIIWRVGKFKKKADSIDVSSLDESTKEMYEKIIKQDIPTNHEIKDLYNQVEEHFR